MRSKANRVVDPFPIYLYLCSISGNEAHGRSTKDDWSGGLGTKDKSEKRRAELRAYGCSDDRSWNISEWEDRCQSNIVEQTLINNGQVYLPNVI
jgi:hypothetical protein